MTINMKFNKYVNWALAALISAAAVSCSTAGPVSSMKCEYQEEPVNIDVEAPRFTWNYNVPEDFIQTSYCLEVAEDAGFKKAVWTSGEVKSSSTLARYGGEKLASHTKYYWRLSYTLDNGKSYTSDVCSFETAMMPDYVWKGQWINDGKDKSFAPSPMLRKSFGLKGDVADAKLYISAAGYYMLFINGADPDNIMLDPGYTHYDLRNLYSVYDLTDKLRKGENVIATVLGSGFYNEDKPVATWNFENARWRDRAKMIAELHIVYKDGSKEIIATDSSWKTATGPYLSENIYSGDVYDARKEIPGWNGPGFDDSGWSAATVTTSPSEKLVAQKCPPIRVKEVIRPVDMKKFGDSIYVFDFGKNISGLCSITLSGEAGTKVTMTHGELMKKDGRVEMGNINIYYNPMPEYEMQTDTYYMKGGGKETFSPMFSYHGFRYMEVKTSAPVELTAEDAVARFFHTDVQPVGEFSCSNELYNRIWQATKLSYLGNLMSIPTDCPQREKNGWTADAYLAVDFALLNFDGISFYEKWIDDMIDNQLPDGNLSGIVPTSDWGYDDWIGPVWAAAWFIIPDSIYRYYGDDTAIRKIFPVCKRYLQYLANRENEDGTVTYGIGDWVWHKTATPTDYTTTCYYYYENLLASKFARMLGEDASLYENKAAQLKKFINAEYFDSGKCLYANGSQTSQGVALYLDIVPEEYKSEVAGNLNDMIAANGYFLDFGTIGSKTVPRMLAENGWFETVYKMAAQKEAPSWGAWMELGLTTLAETWVLDMVKFRDASVNHVFLGDISAWMTNYITGITTSAENGERQISVKPNFAADLSFAKACYKSPMGDIKVEWKRQDGKISVIIAVPANTAVTIKLDKEYVTGGGVHTFTLDESSL